MKNIYSDINNFNYRIKLIRKKLGLTQKEIAKSLGIKQGHWSDIERGIKQPSETLLVAFIYRYAINFDWLKTGEGEMFEHKPEMVAEPSTPIYGIVLDEILKRVKIIYNEGDLDARAKVMGIINAVYDEILRKGTKRKELDAPIQSEHDKYNETKKKASSIIKGEDIRDKAC